MITDINTRTMEFFKKINEINKLQQQNTFGGIQMKATREHIAKAMFCGFLRREDWNDKSVEYIQGVVHAKTDVMLDQDWIVAMAKEIRGRKIFSAE